LSGDVHIISRATFTVGHTIELLPPGMCKSDVTPVGLTMTKDGKTAYVALGRAALIAVVDVATRNIQGYIPIGKRSSGMTLSRDEKTLYIADSSRDDIALIDLNNRKPTILLPVGRMPSGVVVDD
jgi:YVTN family beta-propeller protein